MTPTRLVIWVSDRHWGDVNNINLHKPSHLSGSNIDKKPIIYTTTRLQKYVFKYDKCII